LNIGKRQKAVQSNNIIEITV
jgi:hypothetical protein